MRKETKYAAQEFPNVIRSTNTHASDGRIKMNFILSELATLIRLVEKHENELHIQIDSEDEKISDDAADLSVHVGKISGKLKELYESEWREGSNHPPYNEILKI